MADRKIQEVVMSFDRAGDRKLFGEAFVQRELNHREVTEVRTSGDKPLMISLSKDVIGKYNDKHPGAEVGLTVFIDPMVEKARGAMVTPEVAVETPTVEPTADKPFRPT